MTEGNLPPSSTGKPSNYAANAPKEVVVVPDEDRPTLKKIVDSAPTKKKRGIGSKFRESFAGDDAKSVMQYLIWDVGIPAAKNMLFDMISEGGKRILFGSTGGGYQSSSTRSGSRTGYNRIYNGSASSSSSSSSAPAARAISSHARATHRFDEEITFATRLEAEEVLDGLIAYIDEYKSVTVADLYNAIDISATHVDTKHGWVDLRDAYIRNVREGYRLELPATQQLQ